MTSLDLTGVRAVLFDAVGTVVFPRPPVAAAYAQTAERFGPRVAEDEVERRFRAAFSRQEEIDEKNDWRTGEPRERGRWRAIVAEVFPDAADGEGLFDALWRHFADPAHWAVFDDVADCWRRLKERGLVVGLASNFDGRLEGIVRGLRPLAGCAHVFTSSGLGCRKPGRAFFACIAAALQLPPREIVLVGDDFDNDFLGAQRAGWRAALLDRRERSVPAPSGMPVLAGLAGFDAGTKARA